MYTRIDCTHFDSDIHHMCPNKTYEKSVVGTSSRDRASAGPSIWVGENDIFGDTLEGVFTHASTTCAN